jgi:hypothetical protein
LLGIDQLSPDEQAVFLSDIGDLVFESALLRLVADLTPDQESSLDHYLETEPQSEVLMEYLFTHHKGFEKILEEEIIAFKEEAIAIFGDKYQPQDVTQMQAA